MPATRGLLFCLENCILLYNNTEIKRSMFMAKSHIIKYYLEVEYQYLEMLDTLKELKELVKEGKIDVEAYEKEAANVEKLKENYERISYIMFLLNQPRRTSKKLDTDTLRWYNELKNHSKEAIIDENKDVLCTFKQLVKEGKMKNE